MPLVWPVGELMEEAIVSGVSAMLQVVMDVEKETGDRRQVTSAILILDLLHSSVHRPHRQAWKEGRTQAKPNQAIRSPG